MESTITGTSGRVYIQDSVLRQHIKNPKLNIFKSGNEFYVWKHVPEPFYGLFQHLAGEFPTSRNLRMHIDSNQEEHVLIYPYFRTTLLALMREHPDFPPVERRKILRQVGEALQELHNKNWIHIDVKPDNVLVNWEMDKTDHPLVTKAALGDFDLAFHSEHGEPRQSPYPIGNVMWRSPEGQTGSGVTKASDVYSFGLVCLYVLGAGDLLVLSGKEYETLAKSGISPEQEILTRHFSYFGPVTDGLLQQVQNEAWREALKGASRVADAEVAERPMLRFSCWGADLGPEAVDMITGMLQMDPAARSTIDAVLAHPWWNTD